MKQKILTLILMLFSLTALSQMSDSLAFVRLQQKVEQFQAELKNQKSDFSKQISTANSEIESLQKQVQSNSNAINQTAQELVVQITTAETSTNQKISEVGDLLSKTTLWVIIGLLFAVIISGVLFLLLRKKQQADKTDIVAQLSQTKQAIDEKLVDEFAKNTETLEALSQISKPTQCVDPDHSLTLKVAREINLIEHNISLMDSKTKGLKQLTRSVERLKDNLVANGYEIPQLLGKEFNQGMKIVPVSTIPDDNLEEGLEIISKIIIPQVNYNGKMIQAAQIEISVGTK
jgi:uncharacterized membrane-anchored protein YhcB (DUF1043 family)